jgi:Zn-dependent peptidase ImmA (M78 family)
VQHLRRDERVQLMATRVFETLNDVFKTVPSGADRHAIRNFNFMNKSQPASVGGLAKELGFEVRFEKLPSQVSGYLEPDTWADKHFAIVINSDHSRVRQRFTGLHEIAHFYLHNPKNDFLSQPKHRASFDAFEHIYSKDEMAQEIEANLWLETIIFGEQALEGAIGLYGKDLNRLKLHFGFSEAVVRKAIDRRIKS